MQCPLQFSIGWYNDKKWKAEYSFQLNTSEHCKVKQSCLCCSQCCSCVLTSRAAEFVAGGDNVHRWACIGYSWWHLFIAQYAHCTLCIAHTCWFGQCNIMHMVSDAERNHKLLLLVTFDWTLCTKCMYNSGHRICALCTMQCNMMQRETTVCCSWWPQGWLEAAETPSSSLLVIIVLSVISAIIVTFVIVIIVIFTKMLHSYTLWTQYRSQAPPALVSKLSVLRCQSLVLHINQPSFL